MFLLASFLSKEKKLAPIGRNRISSMPLAQDKDWESFWRASKTSGVARPSWSKRRVLKIVSPYVQPGKCVLDAGCGSGFFSHYFCEQGMKTFALDYSDQALKMVTNLTAGRAQTFKVDLLRESLSQVLPQKVDLIFTDGLFEHFEPREQVVILQNFLSALADGGVVVTFVPNFWSPWQLVRPFVMPGIKESPFLFSALLKLHQENGLKIQAAGGVNTLPFWFSPERLLARNFGMLLYVIGKKN